MPVTSARWRNPKHPDEIEGYDVHVIANLGPSQSLSDLLWLETSPGHGLTATAANAATTNPKITVLFVPEFRPVDFTANPIKHATNDVSVDPKTGVVTFNQHAPLPADILHNFIIRPAVIDETGAALADVPAIRIHLHPGISRAWITPSILTAHKSAGGNDTPVRFRILAEFGDDTNGDITNHPGIVWDTLAPTKIFVKASTAEFWPVNAASGHLQIKATLPSSLGGSTVQGTIRVADPLSTAVTVDPVGQPNTALPQEDQLNILFLSEGYLTTQRNEFNDAVNAATQAMESPRVFPINRMPATVKFWSAFVPSREAGPSVLYETFHSPWDPWYEVVDPPTLPGAHSPSISEVVARTLPVPADQTTTLADQIPRWRNLYGLFASTLMNVDADVHRLWQRIGDRYLIDERDTAFGLAYGERPRAEVYDVPRSIAMSPLRMKREALDLMLSNLSRDGKWGTPGKPSYPFVVFLCAGSRQGGARDPGTSTLAFGVHSELQVQAQVQGFAHQAILDPYPPTSYIDTDTVTTLVHELAHAFGVPAKQYNVGLGDEYGEFPLARPITSSDESDILRYGNIQSEKTIKDAAAKLQGDTIKWAQWHRIAKAAVITSDLPILTSSPFQISHEGTARGEEFHKDEVVRIRGRPVALSPVPTDELKIVSVDSRFQITVEPLNAGVISLFARGKGDIVFVPRRKGATELMMMAKAVRDHITTTNRPLNARRPPAAYACTATESEPQDPRNLPAEGPAFKLPRYHQWIVGIYDGGQQFNCGVFHPTGTCLMRRQTRAYLGDTRNAIYAFCPVCRYILIDNLDPTKHGRADAAYQVIWPEPP